MRLNNEKEFEREEYRREAYKEWSKMAYMNDAYSTSYGRTPKAIEKIMEMLNGENPLSVPPVEMALEKPKPQKLVKLGKEQKEPKHKQNAIKVFNGYGDSISVIRDSKDIYEVKYNDQTIEVDRQELFEALYKLFDTEYWKMEDEVKEKTVEDKMVEEIGKQPKKKGPNPYKTIPTPTVNPYTGMMTEELSSSIEKCNKCSTSAPMTSGTSFGPEDLIRALKVLRSEY